MKKIILLLGIIILTTGCTVDYNLVIDNDNNFKEEILINTESEIESQELKEDPWPTKVYYSDLDSGEYPEKLEGVDYYNEEVSLNNDYYQKKLSYTFEKNNIKDHNIIKSCYEHFYFTKKNNEISLSTSPKFLCIENYPNLNNVNIKITVEKSVVANNADSVNGNTYEWNINKDNYITKGIILAYQEKEELEENAEEDNEEKPPLKSKTGLVSIVIGIFIIFIVGAFVYKIKNNM